MCHPKQRSTHNNRKWYPWVICTIPCFHYCICITITPTIVMSVLCISRIYKMEVHWIAMTIPSQSIISTNTPVDCCIIHLSSIHFLLGIVWAILCVAWIYYLHISNQLHWYKNRPVRVSLHNHRKTTGSNVLPTTSFIPSRTHIHSSCCYYGRLLVNLMFTDITTLALFSHVEQPHHRAPHAIYIYNLDAVVPSDDSSSSVMADIRTNVVIIDRLGVEWHFCLTIDTARMKVGSSARIW